MKIINAKDCLHDQQFLQILSLSQYMPTEEKLNLLADNYKSNSNIYAFTCNSNISIIGVIVIKCCYETNFEILSIAVDSAFRGHGIGSKLISYAVHNLKCSEIFAETDDDAVGFYRSYGFDIVSLDEKYPGIVRYLCTLKLF